jgi:hypothetical protein
MCLYLTFGICLFVLSQYEGLLHVFVPSMRGCFNVVILSMRGCYMSLLIV